ncbi:hypothetical protein PN836_020070 [Ningiella sp. W23]|uniref:hypothetical protein n=1 Tax=Ningiella sp. W23 TaxID=3023715 RepID=UPI0037565E59
MYNQGEIFSVVDLKNGSPRSYQAIKSIDHFGELVETVQPVTTTNRARVVSSSYLDYKRDFGVIPIDVPTNYNRIAGYRDVTSAWQLIENPQLSEWIGQYLTTNSSLETSLEAFVGELAELGLKKLAGMELQTEIVIKFSDSSTAAYQIEFKNQNGIAIGEAEFIEGSARFSDGSKVPTNRNVVGNWFFSAESDATGFIRLGALWNVRFKGLGNRDADPECKVKKSSCRETSDGLECDLEYQCN